MIDLPALLLEIVLSLVIMDHYCVCSFTSFEAVDETTLQWFDFDSCRVQVRVRAIEDIPDFILADAEDCRFEIKVVVAWQQAFYQPNQVPSLLLLLLMVTMIMLWKRPSPSLNRRLRSRQKT
ncbi:hypothetical protein Cni_G29228 [Canna indica]|uniref:Uncharacterized protein n=1 Tax=Canna indica TaxID=4628 RepID=A0AAQ3L7X9_9LILI|nr:hypothetical protein Cni_G29228 [Canna indica]